MITPPTGYVIMSNPATSQKGDLIYCKPSKQWMTVGATGIEFQRITLARPIDKAQAQINELIKSALGKLTQEEKRALWLMVTKRRKYADQKATE